MEATTLPHRYAEPLELARRIDRSAIWTWILGFGLVVYLGLEGGGYDPLVHDQVGIAVWWALLAAALVGAVPRRRLGPAAWAALALLAAFVCWTAISLSWTESSGRTFSDLARIAAYLGVFALALLSRDSRGARRMVAAVGSGIAVVALVGLLSRLHPAWFPAGEQTARFLGGSGERLAYPLNYWNALAALVAIGMPLLLHVASSARSLPARSAAAAALPALALTSFFTLSRGGMAAAAIALLVYLALAPGRAARLLTLLVAAVGSAILIGAALQRDQLQHGLLNTAARLQGDEMLAMTLVVCGGVGLLQAAICTAWPRGIRLPWEPLPRRRVAALATATVLAVVIAAAALGAPGRISHAWQEFKQPSAGPAAGTARLGSSAGEGRYQFWQAAAAEQRSRPLSGTGSGTFEFWWNRHGSTGAVVRDTHSLYMQTLGELGVVGLLLLGGFLLAVLAAGAVALARSRSPNRSQLASALAGVLAFCVVAAFDWMWQIPVLPVAMLLLAAVLVSSLGAGGRRRAPLRARVPLAVAAIAAIAAIAVPLASESKLRQSQAAAAAGEAAAALADARDAAGAEPWAATPRLQEALLLEEAHHLPAAAAAAAAATRKETTDWRPWLVLSRIEAERGRARASLSAYRRASSLDPRSPLFSRR